MKLRRLLPSVFALASLLPVAVQAAPPAMTVYKTRTCGCCGKWVEHMRSNGFAVTVADVESTAGFQQNYGVPDELRSCHTATVGGYAIEGHVPAADVQRLLKSRPKAKGLAVPGMPMGSPGMEGPRQDAYSVLLFGANNRVTRFQNYPAK